MFIIFFSSIDVDFEVVPLQLVMELIDLRYSEDLKSKWLVLSMDLQERQLQISKNSQKRTHKNCLLNRLFL